MKLILIAFVVFALLGTPAIAIANWFKIRDQNRRLDRLEKQLRDRGKSQGQKPTDQASIETAAPRTTDEGQWAPATAATQVPASDPALPRKAEETVVGDPEKDSNGIFEFDFGSRWLVWVGGVALTLGGVFLVKYSIEQGLLGPWGRVIAGIIAGSVMLTAGERLRQRPDPAVSADTWHHIPLSVSGAGITTIYGALFAGYALYDLIPPIVAFGLLAIVAAGALLLSLRHGPLMAGLGLIGAFAVPALVSTTTPSAPLLFGYLFMVVAGGLALYRYREWNWLGWANLAGGLVWVEMWNLLTKQTMADAIVIEFYLFALMCLFLYQFWANSDEAETSDKKLYELRRYTSSQSIILGAGLAVTVLASALAVRMDHALSSSALVLLLTPFFFLIARRRPVLDLLPMMAHGAALFTLITWPIPPELSARAPLVLGDLMAGFPPGPFLREGLEAFATTGILVAAFYGTAGYQVVRNTKRPGLWAAHSVIAPLAVTTIAYWKISGLSIAFTWSLTALLIAATFAAIATRVERKRDLPGFEAALAAYTVGAFGAIGLAFTAALEEHWFTVALALLVPSLAWVNLRLKISALRILAILFAVIVIGRLELNGEVIAYFMRPREAIDWFVYGYGVPLGAFALALSWFRRDKADRLVFLLESGVLVFWVTLLSLTIRHLTGLGYLISDMSVDTPNSYGLAEQSLQSFVWLATGLGLYWLNQRNASPVRSFGWKLLAGMGAAQVLFGHVWAANPVRSSSGGVGEWLILDWLFMAYAVPSVLALAYRALFRREGNATAERVCGIAAATLALLYLSLEVRHLFGGPKLQVSQISDAELYTYSVVWILYGVGLLGGGIWRRSTELRRGALIVLAGTAIKVFIYDMAALEGLLRAISFLGLGASLIGVGILYQRYVLRVEPSS